MFFSLVNWAVFNGDNLRDVQKSAEKIKQKGI